MATTVQAVLDLARVALNDAAKKRYPDAALMGYFNSGLFRLYEIRPDLLLGTGWAQPTPILLANAGTTNIPTPDRFAQVLADYVGSRAEMKDDDAANGGRSQALMAAFEKALVA